jgi:putative addiction module killer protein
MEIRHYTTKEGVDPVQDWLKELADVKARVAVLRRIDRLAGDNFGDCKFCRDGVWELRIDLGPGYRIYYAAAGRTIVVLLLGGSKRSQASDIRLAVRYWQDYRRRHTRRGPHES